MDSNEHNHERNNERNERNQESNLTDVSDLQYEILNALEEKPRISQRKLSEELHKAYITVRREMDDLVEKGYLERINGTRGHWQVNRK